MYKSTFVISSSFAAYLVCLVVLLFRESFRMTGVIAARWQKLKRVSLAVRSYSKLSSSLGNNLIPSFSSRWDLQDKPYLLFSPK